MTVDELRTSLESERAWRQEELAFFKNQLNNIENEDEKDRYRKSLVLILYSHMEGYVKICLQTYVQFINALALPRENFVSGLIVAGMHKEFNAYDNMDKKCAFFKTKLPDDHSLHRYSRRVDFIESLDGFMNDTLLIEDGVIDTESNLWYVVLQKNLYKIGLPIDCFEQYKKDIDALVNRRNSIAHGNQRSGVTQNEFDQWEVKIDRVLTEITSKIYEYALHRKYLKE